jgi:hypothetical protein
MKKTMTTLAVLGAFIAVPTMAAELASTQKSTYTEKTTYHTVQVPLTPEQVAERQQMGTKISETINRFDTNNDHQINRAEFAYAGKLFNFDTSDKATAFYNADANHNGQLSSQELLKAELAAKETSIPVIEPASGSTKIIEKHTTTIVR